MEDYFAVLSDEIRREGRRYRRKVNNIYIGGGTPSIAHRYFPILADAISAFDIVSDAEISVECNPESVTEDFIVAARSLGVNRVSLGVQSLSDALLRRIGRAHDAATAERALDKLTVAFPSVGADVMVGLPGETAGDVTDTMTRLLTHDLAHVSCYSLIVEKGTPLYCDVKRGLFIPDEDHAVDMYDLAADMLAEKGLDRYEISNFARRGAVCRYNLSVWQYGEYLGLGLGASGFTRESTPFCGHRTRRVRDMRRYLSGARPRYERITSEVGKTEYIMLGLRLTEGMDVAVFNALFETDFYHEYGEKVVKLSEYLTISERALAIKPEYFYISNSILSELI